MSSGCDPRLQNNREGLPPPSSFSTESYPSFLGRHKSVLIHIAIAIR